MSLPNVLIFPGVGAALGLLAHQALFIRGEWHVRAPEILVSHTILFASIPTARTFHQGDKYNDLLDGLSYLIFSYVAALLLSITIYRVQFHPLTKAGFPGPWHWRISKLFHVWKARRSKNHIVLEQYRQEYGDFVRTGASSNLLGFFLGFFFISVSLLCPIRPILTLALRSCRDHSI